MKHPVETDLALFAGHELGLVSKWRIGNHVARCEECRATVESFESLRSDTARLGELPPEIAWTRLASEMKANIRLGLAAGECVAGPVLSDDSARSVFSGFQTLLAYAGVIVLVAAGLWLQRPAPVLAQGAVLAATQQGVELSEAGRSFGLQYGASRQVNDSADMQVNYSADMKGAMGARYVDAGTGHVMVVRVDLE